MTNTLTEKANSLKALGAQGQSVWLDYIRRSLIAGGELQRLIEEDGRPLHKLKLALNRDWDTKWPTTP